MCLNCIVSPSVSVFRVPSVLIDQHSPKLNGCSHNGDQGIRLNGDFWLWFYYTYRRYRQTIIKKHVISIIIQCSDKNNMRFMVCGSHRMPRRMLATSSSPQSATLVSLACWQGAEYPNASDEMNMQIKSGKAIMHFQTRNKLTKNDYKPAETERFSNAIR